MNKKENSVIVRRLTDGLEFTVNESHYLKYKYNFEFVKYGFKHDKDIKLNLEEMEDKEIRQYLRQQGVKIQGYASRAKLLKCLKDFQEKED